jgi:hypothetical protein
MKRTDLTASALMWATESGPLFVIAAPAAMFVTLICAEAGQNLAAVYAENWPAPDAKLMG